MLLQNACRKQKMRCEGADNPPCRRCRNTGLDCLFEKPSREATLTGEAGLEYVIHSSIASCGRPSFPPRRIKSLEAHVFEIKNTQTRIQETLAELVTHLRTASFSGCSPSTYPPPSFQQSPSMNSPAAASTPTISHPYVSDLNSSLCSMTHSTCNLVKLNSRQPRSSLPGYQSQCSTVPTQPGSKGDFQPPQISPSYGNFSSNNAQPYQHSQGQILPPFASIQAVGSGASQSNNVPSSRYSTKQSVVGTKRATPSNVPIPYSSDIDDDENGGLPASGLVAPWEVLRGLADVATERAAKVSLSYF